MALLPAALFGFAGLTDGIGPTGWRGFAELFGWFVACLVAAGLLALLLRRGGQIGVPAYGLALAAVAGIGVLAYELLNWLGLDAPMSAKVLYTSSMQALGALGAGFCLSYAAYVGWQSRRR
jgi:hypothetical protein